MTAAASPAVVAGVQPKTKTAATLVKHVFGNDGKSLRR